MNSIEKFIRIDDFIALNGNLASLNPHNIEVDSNFDLEEAKGRTVVPAISVVLGKVNTSYNSYTKRNDVTQLYVVKYLKRGIETTKQVAGHLINVKVEMVLHPHFTL